MVLEIKFINVVLKQLFGFFLAHNFTF